MRGLSPKESRFCRYTQTEKDQQAAAIKAGYSKRSARQIAARLMTKDYIKAEIARLKDKSDDKAIIDRNRIIREWDKIAFRNAKTIYNTNDEMKRMSEISEEDAACISEVMELQTEIGHSRKVKFFSKEAALKELSKLGGLYPEEGTGETTKVNFVFGGIAEVKPSPAK